MYDQMDLDDDAHTAAVGSLTETGAVGAAITTNATKKTADSMRSSELLREALLIWENDCVDQETYKRLNESSKNHSVIPPIRDPLIIEMGAGELEPSQFILKVLMQIRSSHLDDALLGLPFGQVVQLIKCISQISKSKSVLYN